MFDRMPLGSDSVFLDLGCGAGPALVKACEFAPRLVIGLDMDRGSLLAAKALLKSEHQKYLLVQGDMTSLPFKPEAFSHLCCRLAIPYVDQKQTVAEIGRVLDRRGRIFLQLHSWRFYVRLLLKQFGRWKRVVLNGFCLLNGLIFHITGLQLVVPLKKGDYQELHQTERGIRNLLAGVNIKTTWVEGSPLFRLLGIKENGKWLR